MNGAEPSQIEAVERWTLILAAVVTAASFALLSQSAAFAAAVGSGLMAANAWALRRIAAKTLRARARPGAAVLLFNLKMAALVGLLFVIVKVLGVDALGLLLGVSVFPAAIVVAAVRHRLADAEPADASGDF